VGFKCDPFRNIKEPQCLLKWQLLKIDTMVRSYQATLQMYKKLAPMQEKIFRHMEREMEDLDEADNWKYTQQDQDDEPDNLDEPEQDQPDPR